jgi:hypothetical protein
MLADMLAQGGGRTGYRDRHPAGAFGTFTTSFAAAIQSAFLV